MSRTTNDQAPAVSRGLLLALLGLAIAAIAVIVALVATSGGDDEVVDVDAASSAGIPVDGATRQVSFVEIDGTPLSTFDDANDTSVGQLVPNASATKFDNSEVSIDFADGTPRIVMFLAHWCPHCQAEVTDLSQHWGASGLPTDAEIVAVSTSVDEGAPNYPPSDWFLREGFPVEVLRDSADSTFAAAFGVASFPFFVFVDGDGRVVQRYAGNLDPSALDSFASSLPTSS